VTLCKPLDNYPLVRSADPAIIRQVLARVYAAPTLQLRRGTRTLSARINRCALPNIAIAYGCYGGDVDVDFPAVDSFVRVQPLAGTGEIISRRQCVSLGSATCAVVSPDAGFRASYSADYEGLFLKVDSDALASKLAAITGVTVRSPLQLSLESNRAPSAQTLHRYLPVLADMLSSVVLPPPAWWIGQTEQLLMVMILCSHRHAYSHLLEQDAPDPAPWQVRKAEDYIEANAHEAITLEDLAEITGVSAFSLFRSFRKSRGYSPLEFASQVRAKQKWSR
jgi:hypothetical protein